MTYKQAIAKARKNKDGTTYCGDAGDGWTWEVRWCPFRGRVVSVSINPDGMRIV